jgi:hypothetical protein
LVGSVVSRFAIHQSGHHFRVLPGPKIKVIAGMAPMTGI